MKSKYYLVTAIIDGRYNVLSLAAGTPTLYEINDELPLLSLFSSAPKAQSAIDQLQHKYGKHCVLREVTIGDAIKS